LKTQVVGLGAGGHAKVVIEILRFSDSFELIGLLDPKETLWGTDVLGVPVLGGDHLLPDVYKRGVRGVFVGVGATGEVWPRRRLYRMARAQGFEPVTAIHPTAVVSTSARIGCGGTVMAGAIVNAAARLGENVIVNSGAIVEHDCVIGDHAHIAPGAMLASAVHVGEGSHVGLGAAVLQGRRIGCNVVIGAGAVVVRDVRDDVVVTGVPARVLKARSDEHE